VHRRAILTGKDSYLERMPSPWLDRLERGGGLRGAGSDHVSVRRCIDQGGQNVARVGADELLPWASDEIDCLAVQDSDMEIAVDRDESVGDAFECLGHGPFGGLSIRHRRFELDKPQPFLFEALPTCDIDHDAGNLKRVSRKVSLDSSSARIYPSDLRAVRSDSELDVDIAMRQHARERGPHIVDIRRIGQP
jgi:hypothetical protein